MFYDTDVMIDIFTLIMLILFVWYICVIVVESYKHGLRLISICCTGVVVVGFVTVWSLCSSILEKLS